MDEIKKKIEAILFATGRSLSLEELAKLCNLDSTSLIKDSLLEMQKEYDSRISSLQLVGENDLWKIVLRKEYHSLTQNLLHKTELDKTLIETLAVIAWKQPILQSDIVKIRGTLTYDHVKILRELGYVETEKFGRTRKLKLTSKFYDYFDTSKDEVKDKFKAIQDLTEKIENIQKEDSTQLVFIPDQPLV